MKKILALACFLIAGITACDLGTSSSGNNEGTVALADSVLIDTLDNHGTMDTSVVYTRSGSLVSVTLQGYIHAFNVADPRSWVALDTIDTLGLGKIQITSTLSSTAVFGEAGVERSVFKADAFRLVAKSLAFGIQLKDTTMTFSGDSAVYGLLLPSHGKFFLAGNTALITNLQATIAGMIAP